jgi:predicted ATPase
MTVWLLGYPDHARTDMEGSLTNAREMDHAATLMYAGFCAVGLQIYWGNYQHANSLDDELTTLAEQTDAPFWKAAGKALRGCISSSTGNHSVAIDVLTAGIAAWRSTGARHFMTMYLSFLASAHADSNRFNDARRCISEAMTAIEITKERWWEAEVNRIAGEIELKSPEHDLAKAQANFDRALSVARKQRAKSWELRAAMSMARVWRDQGKREEARELLAPVYSWFTEGFDTLDLKEAKALLDELAT